MKEKTYIHSNQLEFMIHSNLRPYLSLLALLVLALIGCGDDGEVDPMEPVIDPADRLPLINPIIQDIQPLCHGIVLTNE